MKGTERKTEKKMDKKQKTGKKTQKKGTGMDTWQEFARLQICPRHSFFQGLALIRANSSKSE